MSWNDPCKECGKPRYACKCICEPKKYTKEEIEERERIQKENEQICKDKGHIWQYVFITYTCKRCGESTEY